MPDKRLCFSHSFQRSSLRHDLELALDGRGADDLDADILATPFWKHRSIVENLIYDL